MKSNKHTLAVSIAFVFVSLWGQGQARAKDDSSKQDRLIDQVFRAPTEAEVERYRELMNRRDLDHSLPDQLAYRCEAFIFDPETPERFISVHGVDRDADAVRHVAHRTFTDDDDPRLLYSDTGPDGFGSTKNGNVSVFPINHDWLRLGDKIFLSDQKDQSVQRDEIRMSSQDRNLNPVACALLPVTSYFRGNAAKRRLSQLYQIEKLDLAEVSIHGADFIVKHPLPSADGRPTGMMMYIKFVDELPVTYEIWRLLKNGSEIIFRTTTQWKEFEELSLPIQIQALQLQSHKRMTVELNFEWKFNEQVPSRLFEIGDVTSPEALAWN